MSQFGEMIKGDESPGSDEAQEQRMIDVMKGGGGNGLEEPERLTDTLKSKELPAQPRIKEIYNSMVIQIVVAFLILANFTFSAVEAQILPQDGSNIAGIFEIVDMIFTVLFTIELAFNFYGHFFWEFWENPWNWFDFFIVSTSLLEVLPGSNVLRLFRAFRVIRLFKRIDSLRNIIDACILSLPDVANAFVILFLLMGVWSIMGVSFFSCKNFDSMCGVYAHQGSAAQSFDTFAQAMFTMWAVLTLEGWVDIALPLIYIKENVEVNDDTFDAGQTSIIAIVFFVSFYFMASIIMMNVVVAILLENYLEATHNQKKAKEKEDPDFVLNEVNEEVEECQFSIRRLEILLDKAQSTGAEEIWPGNPEMPEKISRRLEMQKNYFLSLRGKYIIALSNVVRRDVGGQDFHLDEPPEIPEYMDFDSSEDRDPSIDYEPDEEEGCTEVNEKDIFSWQFWDTVE